MTNMPESVTGHRAFIMDRGGEQRVCELNDLSLVRWERVRDDISESTIRIEGTQLRAQQKKLDGVAVGRHELCLFRGDERVWEGPLVGETDRGGSSFELRARDVMHYSARTVMHQKYDSSFPNVEYVTSRAARIMRAELARKEALGYNLLSYIFEHHVEGGAKTTRVTEAYSSYVFTHIDDLAAKSGMDYTVIGRAVHLWDVDQPAMGQTQTVTDADFLGPPTVSRYGTELATRSISTDGQGGYGIAGGVDPFYGEVEFLATAYDEEKDEELPTSAELNSQAIRNLSGRNPTPTMVRIPDNSRLNPNGKLGMKDLVPGVRIPLRASLGVRTVDQMQKLDKVRVEETPEGEKITVTLSPAASDDGGGAT